MTLIPAWHNWPGSVTEGWTTRDEVTNRHTSDGMCLVGLVRSVISDGFTIYRAWAVNVIYTNHLERGYVRGCVEVGYVPIGWLR